MYLVVSLRMAKEKCLCGESRSQLPPKGDKIGESVGWGRSLKIRTFFLQIRGVSGPPGPYIYRADGLYLSQDNTTIDIFAIYLSNPS